MAMNRRDIIFSALAGLTSAQSAPPRRYRVAIIGDTGRGNYGHDWDVAWNSIPHAEVVAVADPDETGRQRALSRSHARKGYTDYHEMLATEHPDIVTICPRWLDQRVAMVTAAAESRAHILMEKPFARSLPEADEMLATIERRGIKVQVGHTARVAAVTDVAGKMLHAGDLGTLLEIRGRGKEDRRAGGEDLVVLGTHVFDLMRYFAGDPEWVFGNITQNGKDVVRAMARQATEPIGPIAGDDISAQFRFGGGVTGYFGSKASDDSSGRRFGVTLYGSQAALFVPLYDVPGAPPYLIRSATWVGAPWERIPYPADQQGISREKVNALMATDLMQAIETGRNTICSARDGRWTCEMITGIYQSHFSGSRTGFPLKQRNHPLA
jgi:predicted dehydrogenase